MQQCCAVLCCEGSLPPPPQLGGELKYQRAHGEHSTISTGLGQTLSKAVATALSEHSPWLAGMWPSSRVSACPLCPYVLCVHVSRVSMCPYVLCVCVSHMCLCVPCVPHVCVSPMSVCPMCQHARAPCDSDPSARASLCPTPKETDVSLCSLSVGINGITPEMTAPTGPFRNVGLSRAAQTHRLRKLRAPSKCRECNSYVYFQGAECEEVMLGMWEEEEVGGGPPCAHSAATCALPAPLPPTSEPFPVPQCYLACHKKCLETLAIQCGHKKLQGKLQLFGQDFLKASQGSADGIPFIVKKCISEIEKRALKTKVSPLPSPLLRLLALQMGSVLV